MSATAGLLLVPGWLADHIHGRPDKVVRMGGMTPRTGTRGVLTAKLTVHGRDWLRSLALT
ncbi:hypothetical protein [Actinokineospora sp. UTMC 2448]|uniref:hypothetical protein n=1 Tax=Actinokineospora sp. UTMC 2448 TaxID=2268449 RepID=UPI0021642223|nr:hypothetical protein [Actinokineospora sp. UTMC 2448]UVS78173.1 hypothetical protein Actkin_01897 [Actinokineospora sp. UTMC 2448]